MDDLSDEGQKINERMRTNYHTFHDNPDFDNTLGTIQKMLSQIGTVKERLETLWDTRHEKLKTNLKQRTFETEAGSVSWANRPIKRAGKRGWGKGGPAK